MGRRAISAAVVAIAIAIVAGNVIAQERPARAPEVVTVGYLPIISYEPFFIALEKGYFVEQGIKVEMTRFGDSGKMMGPMASGELDVGTGGVAAGLFNSIATGVKIKAVADKGSLFRGSPPYQFFVVRKDLAQEIRTFSDYKGRVIHANVPGSPVRYYLGLGLQRGGLTERDIVLKFTPFPQMSLALKKREADIIVVVEPHGTRAVQGGEGAIFADSNREPIAEQQVGVIMYSEVFIRNRAEAARRFMVAYVKACRFYNELKNRAEIAAISSKYTGIDREAFLRSTIAGIRPDGRVDVKSIMDQQEFWHALGLVQKKVKAEEVVDSSFVDHANKALGPPR